MRVAILAVMLMLSGCGLSPLLESHQGPSPQALQHQVLAYWTGKPLAAAQARYGNPSGCQSQDAVTGWCFWRVGATRTYNYPTTNTVSGQIGDAGRYPYKQPIPYTATVEGSRQETQQYACTLQIRVDGQNTITGASLDGQMGACTYFKP